MKQGLRNWALQGAGMIAGVAAALGVAGVARGTIPLFPPAIPEGYVVTRSEHYTLYAPSVEASREGEDEIRHARRQFRHHFGADSRELVVFLADRPVDFRSVKLGALQRRGAGFLPFLTQKHLEAPRGVPGTLALDVGAVLRPVGASARVVAVLDSSRAAAAGIRVGDVVAALNGAPVTELDSIARRFQMIPAGGMVRLDVRGEGGPVRVEYRKGRSAERQYADSAAKFIGQAKVLAHEACHNFVAGYATELGADRKGRGYGHAALPDWFDEMAATLCESSASKERRRMHLRAQLGRRIPLVELATMKHPLTAEELMRIVEMGRATPGAPVQVLSGPEVQKALGGTNTDLFYAQSLSLGEFIFERGGQGALQALARHFVAGRSFDEALREMHRTRPAIPSGIAELEKDWLDWVSRGE